MTEMNKIYNVNCLEGLKSLPDESVNCCVTSPPYFGLRDYGHENQIGLEETPDLYVQKMVEVFTEVRRVLKKDGTLWLNLGDSYAGSGGAHKENHKNPGISNSFKRNGVPHFGELGQPGNYLAPKGMKPKDLIGIPWMVAFALRSSGWYLRQDIIWAKPNPMPESVTDRCTKAHEYIFLLSKSAKYYYDHEAIKQIAVSEPHSPGWVTSMNDRNDRQVENESNNREWAKDGRANKRSVWTVTTKPFSEAHFATFPEDLIVDCIKAGCPEDGIVLDPFMGAGTTALVASKLNRNFIGFELNPDYIEIIKKRMAGELGMFNKLTA
jgi:DNA modification methylase